jgi:hypothetical protein
MEQSKLVLRPTFRSELSESAFSGGLRTNQRVVRISHSAFASIFSLAVVLAATAACSLDTIPKATLTKQIFLEQHGESIVDAPAGNPRAIVPLSGGEVVLAGSTLSAWASRFKADGTVAWRYVDPRDDSYPRPNQSQSEFTGAVGLSDGSVMLCGSRFSIEGEQGLLVHVGATGEVLSRELLSPAAGAPFKLSSLDRCLAWNDGIVLMGVVPQSPVGMGWMIRLASGGKHLWEKVGQDQLSGDAITLQDQTLVLARTALDFSSIELKTMSFDGVVTHRRTFPCGGPCGYFNLFRNVGKDTDFNLEVLGISNTSLYHLGPDLLDRQAPVGSMLILSRRSFRLASGPLLIFGQGHNEAMVASIDKRGGLHSLYSSKPIWDPLHRTIVEESIKFDDAAAISEAQFVSVRTWNAPLDHRGVYLEWFQIE